MWLISLILTQNKGESFVVVVVFAAHVGITFLLHLLHITLMSISILYAVFVIS